MKVKWLLNIGFFVSLFFVLPLSTCAQTRGYSSADRQTFLNDITDTIVTQGMSPQDKKKIKRERHEIRRAARLEKERVKKNSKTQKKIKKQQRQVLDKIEAEKGAKVKRCTVRNREVKQLNAVKYFPEGLQESRY